MNDSIKYYSLSFFVGILIKLYDDIYDNNLYDFFDINKDYTNELLKLSGVIGFVIVSLKYSFVYVFFVGACLTTYFINKLDYGTYEISGLLASLLMIPFLQWNEPEYLLQNISTLVSNVINSYISDKISNSDKNPEYSDIKLLTRMLSVSGCLFTIGLAMRFDHFSPSMKATIAMSTGYMLTSCCFQYFLLSRDCNDVISDKHGSCNDIDLDATD